MWFDGSLLSHMGKKQESEARISKFETNPNDRRSETKRTNRRLTPIHGDDLMFRNVGVHLRPSAVAFVFRSVRLFRAFPPLAGQPSTLNTQRSTWFRIDDRPEPSYNPVRDPITEMGRC